MAPRIQPQLMKRQLALLALLWFCGDGQAATVFYLHGKIVEDHGDNAVHPRYGTYEYGKIVSRLKAHGHQVISQIRAPSTDRAGYAAAVAREIRSLIDRGTPAKDIVVVGFSKGAQIAILVSQALSHDEVRFVFQAVCGSWLSQYQDLRVYGNILSQYETSDAAGSCNVLFRRSNAQTCELSITTGMAHGAFYRPLDEWFLPQMRWIADGNCGHTGND